uniref:Uncharacterized protein n=1 Tax=Picornavirales sp. TaxID=1955153 RepID=A0A514DBQ7_9VIRU|nr:MAG: hypothetical protein H3BulkLitter161558_000002 [Picornavirales sp.]
MYHVSNVTRFPIVKNGSYGGTEITLPLNIPTMNSFSAWMKPSMVKMECPHFQQTPRLALHTRLTMEHKRKTTRTVTHMIAFDSMKTHNNGSMPVMFKPGKVKDFVYSLPKLAKTKHYLVQTNFVCLVPALTSSLYSTECILEDLKLSV